MCVCMCECNFKNVVKILSFLLKFHFRIFALNAVHIFAIYSL